MWRHWNFLPCFAFLFGLLVSLSFTRALRCPLNTHFLFTSACTFLRCKSLGFLLLVVTISWTPWAQFQLVDDVRQLNLNVTWNIFIVLTTINLKTVLIFTWDCRNLSSFIPVSFSSRGFSFSFFIFFLLSFLRETQLAEHSLENITPRWHNNCEHLQSTHRSRN